MKFFVLTCWALLIKGGYMAVFHYTSTVPATCLTSSKQITNYCYQPAALTGSRIQKSRRQPGSGFWILGPAGSWVLDPGFAFAFWVHVSRCGGNSNCCSQWTTTSCATFPSKLTVISFHSRLTALVTESTLLSVMSALESLLKASSNLNCRDKSVKVCCSLIPSFCAYSIQSSRLIPFWHELNDRFCNMVPEWS